MNIKYDLDDFEKVIKKEMSVKEMSVKYGVSSSRIRQALIERGYHINKRVMIKSPYKTIICQDKQKCADELKVSRQTIINALKGKKVAMFDELGITIEYVDDEL